MTHFTIPPLTEPPTSGTPTSGTETESAKSDYSIEDFLIDQHLLPRKRGDARHKAMRLLVQGRLRVTKVEGELVIAECRGDSGEVYHLGHEPGAQTPWRCTCPARTACSHLHALWAVVAVKR